MCSWISFMVLLLCFSFNGIAGARHQKQLHSAAIVVGTVYCDTCNKEVSKSIHFISGAKVAVGCGGEGEKRSFRVEVKTNEKGEFEAKLPVSVGTSEENIRACSVRLISSGDRSCTVAATATSSEIRFKSNKAGTHVFSAGSFTFKPESCNQKDSVDEDFPPSVPDSPTPFFMRTGLLPPPPLRDLRVSPLVPPPSPLPGVPLIPPVTGQESSKSDQLADQKFPSPLLPFPPSPPPPWLPPLYPSPPSPLPFPPLPSVIPSRPVFPMRLPPVPGFRSKPVQPPEPLHD